MRKIEFTDVFTARQISRFFGLWVYIFLECVIIYETMYNVLTIGLRGVEWKSML